MKIVIDTNCLLSCIGKKSIYRNVFDAFLSKEITFCVNSEILLEYEELFNKFWGQEVTNNLLGLFESSDNFEHINVSYQWQLVSQDADDNKFVDVYLAANANVLVSNDKAVNQLRNFAFPSLQILTLEEFSHLLSSRA